MHRLDVVTRRLVCALATTTLLAGAGPGATPAVRRLPTGANAASDAAAAWLPGRPNDLALSPDGRLLAVKMTHGLALYASGDHRQTALLTTAGLTPPMPRSLGGGGSFGMLWAPDGKALWLSDSFARVREVLVESDGRARWGRAVELTVTHGGQPDFSAPNGMALNARGDTAYVALENAGAVAAVDLTNGREIFRVATGAAPAGVAVARGKVYVSNQGRRAGPSTAADRRAPSGDDRVVTDARGIALGGTVTVIDPARRRPIASIDVPAGVGMLTAAPGGATVFAASPATGEVIAIDTASSRTRAYRIGDRLAGGSPNYVLAPGGGRVWISLAGLDQVVQLDLASGRVSGGIDTLWYPSALALERDGSLAIAAMKGDGSSGLEHGFTAVIASRRRGGFNVYDFAGAVQVVRDPARALRPFRPLPQNPEASLPPVRHIVYIIKENRTYDEMLGDMAEGHGDSALCEFCDVTPNHHALAREFVLLDGFRVNGTLSADGHQWTSQDAASDYVERAMGGFPRSYPSDGTDPLAYSTGGFIWDRVLDAGLTFRDYGEFITSSPASQSAAAKWADFYRDWKQHEHTVAVAQEVDIPRLRAHVVKAYPPFDLRIPDQVRADAFIADMRASWAQGRMPALSLMLLGDDHTSGTGAEFPTPKASVADNDLALGRVVEALSHGPFWKDTLVLVVEDDAQSGVDHLDPHRTVALAIGPATRGRGVDSSFYNQSSFVRLIERLLGLAPMTIFDRLAPDAAGMFTGRTDATPYDVRPAVQALDEMNPARAASTAGVDPLRPDSGDAGVLAGQIWAATRPAAVTPRR